MADELRTGGCLCGAVRYRVTGRLRPVICCHCNECRRLNSHFAAFTAAAKTALELVKKTDLRWYESSPGIRRGFCGICGASLFWERIAGPNVSIAAGTLDSPTGLAMVGHLYVAEVGDYYAITDGLPCFAGSDDGTLGSDAA